MTQLSSLEMAVGTALAHQVSVDRPEALIEQLKTAIVSGRDFTGIGFFTEFTVDKRLPPAATIDRSPVGWVRCLVGPDAYPMEFMIYVRDGYAEMIEAYSFDDGYGDIDLLTTTFTTPAEVTPQT